MLTIDDILRGVDRATLAYPHDKTLSFNNITHDSRLIGPGDLFVALRGERDGHDFVPDAIRRGARGALVDHLPDTASGGNAPVGYVIVDDTLAALQQLAAYWRRQHRVSVVGITGSVGKTTTKEAIARVLGRRFRVLKNEKNLNNEIGLPLTVLQLTNQHEIAVLEMGMYALGEISALCDIAQPRIAVVTNVGPSHLERLGSIERIAEAKSELVRAIPEDGAAILNGDDNAVRAMARLTAAKSVFYGLGPGCEVRARNVRTHGLAGISYSVELDGGTFDVTAPTPGLHNVYAGLATVSVGVELGSSWSEITEGLSTASPESRIVTVGGKCGSILLDDTYNASPASMCAALDLLSELGGRRIAILGDMLELGNYEQEGHLLVGRHAAKTVDHLIVVGRRAQWIGEAAMSSGLKSVVFASDKKDVQMDLSSGDHVLIKGSRGMHMEEIVDRLRGGAGS